MGKEQISGTEGREKQIPNCLNSLLEQLIQRHCLWVSNDNKTCIAFDFNEGNVIFYFIFKKQNKLE